MYEKEIISWFKSNKRDLPWRKTDAWGVLVSEFMLQQTPVTRVLPVYTEWIKRWPTAESLAKAKPAEVITAWGRLGYPRRALRLHECAKVITSQYKGRIPREEAELRALPGIGEYTAAAMVAFAFNDRSLVLDINIRRLFARLYDGVETPKASATRAEKSRYEELIPKNEAHVWAAATMELGALICTSQTPKCGICPVAKDCTWRSLDYPKSDIVKRRQTWHGTDRQCRGAIVQALRENQVLKKSEIAQLWDVPSQLEKALLTLLDDGLIEARGKSSYSLPRN
ncbi:A/G-specific adenine glycosylase [Candidatus Planktophila versatilis]|uniref:A/G-specific adenine glycosylase n=1 Tax=Candidatus Planktophila versatilis TaxID=1884905 RepID=A0ABM6MFR8_9ACTN|nr:A/G-specific adenine glycosylase [Candidatus Planktophila versatilis]ASY17738.1 A/G-specific adenine glycosylase [Candidatus Planktophila versatilis]